MTPRLGAVAFTVLWGEMSYQTVMLNALSYKAGEQYNCDRIQVTMNCDTWRCQRACHQFLLNALASSVFWSPHNGVLPRGCRLPAFIEEAVFREVDSGVCRGLLAC